MSSTTLQAFDTPSPKWSLWLGRGLSGVVSVLLLLSAVMKISEAPQMVAGLHDHLGYTLTAIKVFGLLEIGIVALYLARPTAVLGAILMAGYLGGAVSAHVRGDEPFFLPLGLAILGWAGLYLRNRTLRTLLPQRAR